MTEQQQICFYSVRYSSVQPLSCVQLFETPWTAESQASLSIANSQSLFKLMSIESVMSSHPLLSPSPPAFNVFQHQGLFKWVSSLHRWPKYGSFSFNIRASNEHSGLMSFRMDWLDLLVVQGTLKSLLQHHSSKALILQCSAFFIVQLSHPYMTIGKTIALTRWTFVGKVMFLLFNMLSAAAAAKSLPSCRTLRPQRQQPTRLPRPWDSPGKNTGVGCHFLLQCMKVKSESEVAQLCLTLATPWTAAYETPPSMGFSRQKY